MKYIQLDMDMKGLRYMPLPVEGWKWALGYRWEEWNLFLIREKKNWIFKTHEWYMHHAEELKGGVVDSTSITQAAERFIDYIEVQRVASTYLGTDFLW